MGLPGAEILRCRAEAPCQGKRRQGINAERYTCTACQATIGPGKRGRLCLACRTPPLAAQVEHALAGEPSSGNYASSVVAGAPFQAAADRRQQETAHGRAERYTTLLASLEELWRTGQGESPEADALRDEMDALYPALTRDEVKALYGA